MWVCGCFLIICILDDIHNTQERGHNSSLLSVGEKIVFVPCDEDIAIGQLR